MNKNQPITKKQLEVLEFIKAYSKEHRRPPTQKEIQDHFQFSSLNSVGCHLKRLVRHGRIEHTPDISRGIRVIR